MKFVAAPIDWPSFWEQAPTGEDWIIEPLLPRGRHAGIFSSAGQGKSLLALDISAAMACGRPVFGRPPAQPIGVVYLDLEMTLYDLRDRLDDLGYGPDDDLARLHYFQLPTLPPLDSRDGGEALMGIVRHLRPGLVVLDTMTAIVTGEENSADTYRDFHRHTGLPLKSEGVSLLRLDHAGKDLSRGQRGSSSKADELDVVWQLGTTGNQVILVNKKRREPYVPNRVVLLRESSPTLRHVLAPTSWPAGTVEVAELLDVLGVTLDATAVVATRVLAEASQGRRKSVVLAALKLRRERVHLVPGTERNRVLASNVVSRNRVPPQRGEPVPDDGVILSHIDDDFCACVSCGQPSSGVVALSVSQAAPTRETAG